MERLFKSNLINDSSKYDAHNAVALPEAYDGPLQGFVNDEGTEVLPPTGKDTARYHALIIIINPCEFKFRTTTRSIGSKTSSKRTSQRIRSLCSSMSPKIRSTSSRNSIYIL